MFSKQRGSPVGSPAPGAGPAGNSSPAVTDAERARMQPSAAAEGGGETRAEGGGETRSEHFRRKAHRTRLHGYAVVAVALAAYVIALAATNTAHVKVSWVFGTSHVSLVWLVLFAAILGWLLGLLTSARFHWRTRTPKRQRGARRRARG